MGIGAGGLVFFNCGLFAVNTKKPTTLAPMKDKVAKMWMIRLAVLFMAVAL
jgi:hypothetical protein